MIGIVKVFTKTMVVSQRIIFLLCQTVASKLHGTEVDVQILKSKEECDHVQFLITETSGPAKIQHLDIEEIETLSLGEQ